MQKTISKTDELVLYLNQTQDYKPKIAGMARLEYYTPKLDKGETWSFPRCTREGKIITISTVGYDMLQLLPDFSQFLLIGKPIKGLRDEYLDCYFGGTDENPFLVSIMPQDVIAKGFSKDTGWYKLWKEGEFYDFLKPDKISTLEKDYGLEKTLRQGDIFAYPHPTQNWKDIMVNYLSHDIKLQEGRFRLFETRHEITGTLLETRYSTIAQGIIRAPDHNDLNLKQICVLAQTAHLSDPTRAD